MGYDIVNVDKNTIQVSAPLRRSDINMIQDIYEDLARHIGLENIPEIPSAIHVKKSEPSLVAFTYKLAESLVSTLQFYQVESYPWYSKERIELLGVKTEKL